MAKIGTADERTNYSEPRQIVGKDESKVAEVITRPDGRDALCVENIGWGSKLRYIDMNASNGGVARGTSVSESAWVTVFDYAGAGYLAGFVLNLDTFPSWLVRLQVDNADVLMGSGGLLTDDMTGDTLYDLDDVADVNQSSLGLSKGSHDRIVFTPPLNLPIKYRERVRLMLKRTAGASVKKFQAGLIILSKEA